ncbi:FHA domain-containing protein [Cellulomonas cellasea]|uniref:FHA domain-containing protein n=1 Tax=Cellulomonas cellasea TaxID=43670 RepID=A0A7W4UC13_9CELL|nr:FHA domain-containing protein [Cellulomonas cellasea]MBB2921411.1 hypothetical protein [Cellulomonas cellasea]
MIVPEYTPGDWHAVVAGGVVALLAPTTPPSVVRAVWDAVPADGGLADQLEVLLTGGIARLQPFALVDLTGGRVHAALRGPVEVEVSGPDGSSVLAAGEVTTWSERVAEGADVVTVRVAGTGAWSAEGALPVVSGVVRASAVQVPLAVRDGAGAPETLASEAEEAPSAPAADASAGAAAGASTVDGPDLGSTADGSTVEPAAATVGAEDSPSAVEVAPAGAVDLVKPVGTTPSDEPAADVEPEPATRSGELPLATGRTGSQPVVAPAAAVPTASAAPAVPAAPVLPLHIADLPLPAFQAVETAAPAREQADPEAPRDPQADLARTWSTPTPVLPVTERPTDHAVVTPALVPDDDLDDDDTYGADVVAAAEAVLQGEAAAQADPDFGDDHDGLTILSSDLVAIRDQLPSWAGDEVPGPFRVVAPEVDPTAKLVLSTGLVVALDRSVLLGRAPQVSRVTNRELPRLVTVPSPQQDISRTHAEVRAEGDDVLVTDLNSTNGILVSRPGERARRLHPGEATVVAAGEVVDLGDGVTFTVERGA